MICRDVVQMLGLFFFLLWMNINLDLISITVHYTVRFIVPLFCHYVIYADAFIKTR